MYNIGTISPDITSQQLNKTQANDTRAHIIFYFRKKACASLISLPIAFVLFQGFIIFLFCLKVTIKTTKCPDKLKENVNCSSANQCLEPIIKGNCSVDFNCRVDKYLECNNGTCQCISEFPFWSDGYNQCIVPKSYTEFCYSQSDCNAALNLVCRDGTQNCSCPINIQSTSLCDCVRRIDKEYYWNGTSCTLALDYNEECSNSSTSYMCKKLTQGTICSGTTNFSCKCPPFQYYNNSNKKCENQKSNNVSCSQHDECRIDLGLSCIQRICQCNSTTQFWNETTCTNYYTYNTGVCLSDNECNEESTGLICKNIGRSCGCPEQVEDGGYCDCEDRYSGNEHYWNGSKCVIAGTRGASCNSSYQCQELTLLLTCDNLTKNCVCLNNSIYNDSTGHCIAPATSTVTPRICASGWTVRDNACYKSVPINQANGFKNLNNQTISTKCNHSSSSLALSKDYGTGDTKWLQSIVCNSSNIIGYFGPVANTCPVFDCSINNDKDKFTTHNCGHGSSNDHHFMICKYLII
jgi:hypothetical protein